MPKLTTLPPVSTADTVTDVLHGVPIADPYRWLEDSRSSRTRMWLAAQTHYARTYLDVIPGRQEIRARVRQFLEIETYDSILSAGDRYFFRKRSPHEEQPGIYMRQGVDGQDERLLDPASRGTGPYTSLKPLRISPNGRFLLYEIKYGGERAASFEIFDAEAREVLPDRLPHGYLRSFWFSSDSTGFFYVHEPFGNAPRPSIAARHHCLGSTAADGVLFEASDAKEARMYLASDGNQLGVLLYRFHPSRTTEFHFSALPLAADSFAPLVAGLGCSLGPVVSKCRILAITDHEAPNLRIVEIPPSSKSPRDWKPVIPESDSSIRQWALCGDQIVVLYLRSARIQVQVFDHEGRPIDEIPFPSRPTVRLLPADPGSARPFFEAESFTERPVTYQYDSGRRTAEPWTKPVQRAFGPWDSRELSYTSADGTPIPITLVGHSNVLADGPHPTIMTSYGGFASPMLPQFSVFVTCLVEAGCLFALPHIRGGAEFGAAWHQAAQGRKRQRAFDDFLGAAEWLISSGRTVSGRLAIFGGSHSGLLAGVAYTQRPELFKAALCVAPLLDMLRYHLFDQAFLWKEELGTAESAEDFCALSRYSPYHNVRDGVAYPALLLVAGDADGNCNGLHARKMTARVQAATASENPILLDYSVERGHSAVLPLSMRVGALTDRIAFVCDQLGLSFEGGA
jgi:prolyl oligopeptidase